MTDLDAERWIFLEAQGTRFSLAFPLVSDFKSLAAMVMYVMDDTGFQTVYNTLSFSLASMMATTMYLWFRSFAVKDKYQSAVLISGLVTFIAAYHYIRIFNSWVESYEYQAGTPDKYGALFIEAPKLTGVPFNDAYRYMDWLLTVPLLLIEILLVMKLPDDVFSAKAKTLGLGSALMIISGYYGELVVTGDLTPRWICWAISMLHAVLVAIVVSPCYYQVVILLAGFPR